MPEDHDAAVAQMGGLLVGPQGLAIISATDSVRHLAEMGVVFLLFSIGLELSIDKLMSLAKFVFGLGLVQARRLALACAR